MNMQTSVTTVLGKYATFSGRAPRSEYWWWVLALILLMLVLGVIDGALLAPVMGFEAFSPEVAGRPQILAANKADLLGRDRARLARLKRMAARRKIPVFAVSALKREGLGPLVEAVARELDLLTAKGGRGEP